MLGESGPRMGAAGSAHSGPGGWAAQKETVIGTKLFVGNLNFDTTKDELESLFSEIGQVTDCFLPTDRETGRPRGFAFVEYSDELSAANAVEKFDGYELGGRNLRVNEAEERRRAPRAPRSFGGGGGGDPMPPGGPVVVRQGKTKGSRRNLRRQKRSL